MQMDTKMDRSNFPEWMVLDIIFVMGMAVYVAAQILLLGYVTDILFVILLLGATVFLNYRQWDLYNTLMKGEGEEFFRRIYLQEEHRQQVNFIFLRSTDNYIAVIYAILFAITIWGFHAWDDNLILKVCFSLFLFTANIPTGYAIIRILKYFYYNIKWIRALN